MVFHLPQEPLKPIPEDRSLTLSANSSPPSDAATVNSSISHLDLNDTDDRRDSSSLEPIREERPYNQPARVTILTTEILRSNEPYVAAARADFFGNEVRPASENPVVYPRTEDPEKQRKAAEKPALNPFRRLGWKRNTIVLLVEAVALGTLSIPQAYAILGLIPGIIATILIGIVAVYTSYIVGQVKLKYPQVSHYADAGRLMFGRVGYEIISVMFVLELLLLIGSHCLTGQIAFSKITDNALCALMFGAISAFILLLLACPPTFSGQAILGYIDFGSIIVAVLFTIIVAGHQTSQTPGGFAVVDWSLWPAGNVSNIKTIVALTNIIFAYSFAICQFSFMSEMHTPEDYTKSIYWLGAVEIVLYTLTGTLVYVFVGSSVQSPALLSAGPLYSKIGLGLALPVIFISGSINTTVMARYIHGRIYGNSPTGMINTRKGWATWILLITFLTVVAWVVSEALPCFADLLGLCSALFISGFTFYLPSTMWFKLLCEGSPWERKNLAYTIINGFVFLLGVVILICGTYASINDIMVEYAKGTFQQPFACAILLKGSGGN